MSLKPKKVSEVKRSREELNAKMQKKKKTVQETPPPFMYVVSEGTKTEPNYIIGIAKEINAKYYNLASCQRIVVQGVGRNTMGLLEYARKQVEIDHPRASVVWLMYDRDDFPLDRFDNTQYSALQRQDARKYRVAWSNECIELWFLLHFQDLTVNVGRKKYRELLKEYCGYEKNMPDVYEVLKDKTESALSRAKRQHEQYGDIAPSKMCPATTVYQLVEELRNYL